MPPEDHSLKPCLADPMPRANRDLPIMGDRFEDFGLLMGGQALATFDSKSEGISLPSLKQVGQLLSAQAQVPIGYQHPAHLML